MEAVLSVKNITKTFKLSRKQQKIEKSNDKIKVAVNDLSFDAYSGEIYGLLGPNGAGKTTALRSIATLIVPDSGDIFVKGTSAISQPNEVRKKIGFLTTELKLEDFFTPNYLFDFFADLHNVAPATRKRRKAELFTRFGIDSFAEVKIGELSSGMKQKASIAISLVHDPEIIIFDEPTNGLDVLTAKAVTDYLLELKAQNKTIIISTHILSVVEKICDRVGIIFDGSMQVSGPLAEVTQGKSLEELFFNIYERTQGEDK